MQFEESKLSGSAPRARLVILCHEADREEVRSIIDVYAPLAWRTRGEICILEVGTRAQFQQSGGKHIRRRIRHDHLRLAKTLDRIAPPEDAARLILLDGVVLIRNEKAIDFRSVTQIRSLAELRTALPKILVNLGLDWLTGVASTLAHYHLPVDRDSISGWRQQFAAFGDNEWIGDSLLKLLDFWPSSRVCEALFQIPGATTPSTEGSVCDWIKSYDNIAFNAAETGDSSSVVCRLAKKSFGDLLNRKRVDFTDHIRGATSPSRILLIEDCLITGTETIRLLSQFTPEQMDRHIVELKFADGTMFGLRRLEWFLKKQGLTTIRILPPATGWRHNLTDSALAVEGFGDITDEDGQLLDPKNHLINGVHLSAKGYFNKHQRKNIVSFCKAIGRPLMAHQLAKKRWPQDMILRYLDNWSLGFSGLGLLVAYAHGIPKPALPLLWIDGPVSGSYRGFRFNSAWVPLFPTPVQPAAH